jgi:hypothetical protein
LEHAFVRAFHVAIKEGLAIETMCYTLGLMDYLNSSVVEELLHMGKVEDVLLFLVDALYKSQEGGYFTDIPRVMIALKREDNIDLFRHLENKVLHPYIPRIGGIISESFSRIQNPSILFLALDKYRSSPLLSFR